MVRDGHRRGAAAERPEIGLACIYAPLEIALACAYTPLDRRNLPGRVTRLLRLE